MLWYVGSDLHVYLPVPPVRTGPTCDIPLVMSVCVGPSPVPTFDSLSFSGRKSVPETWEGGWEGRLGRQVGALQLSPCI